MIAVAILACLGVTVAQEEEVQTEPTSLICHYIFLIIVFKVSLRQPRRIDHAPPPSPKTTEEQEAEEQVKREGKRKVSTN